MCLLNMCISLGPAYRPAHLLVTGDTQGLGQPCHLPLSLLGHLTAGLGVLLSLEPPGLTLLQPLQQPRVLAGGAVHVECQLLHALSFVKIDMQYDQLTEA